jgi:hypothetical protein
MDNPMLIFIDAADDAAMFPLDRLVATTVAADATILMHFESNLNDANEQDLITITCTSDKELQVMKSIAAGINAAKRNNGEGYVVIADDVNSTYVDSAITGIAYTLDT